MQLKLVNIKDETPNVKTFRFEHPDKKKFSFLPGQFVFIYLNLNGETVKRAYSISSPPGLEFIELTIKLTPGGKATSYFFEEAKTEEIFEVSEPMGKFTYDNNKGKNITLIAAGSGIAPMRSIISYCKKNRINTKINLLYCVKTERDIIYKEENFEVNYVVTLTRPSTNWKGNVGRIDKFFIKKNVKDIKKNIFYLCGPLKFIRDMFRILIEIGVDRQNIRRDVWA